MKTDLTMARRLKEVRESKEQVTLYIECGLSFKGVIVEDGTDVVVMKSEGNHLCTIKKESIAICMQ